MLYRVVFLECSDRLPVRVRRQAALREDFCLVQKISDSRKQLPVLNHSDLG